MSHREGEQVEIRNLSWAVNPGAVDQTFVEQAQVIRPEFVNRASYCAG